jgi:hypothetical protein
VLGKGLLNEGGQVLLGCAGRFELAEQASFSRRWPQPPTSDTALFAEVPSWGFASQLCVFSKVVTVSASENTIFSETG